MLIKEHEAYQLKIYMTTLRIYYLSTEGKVGYVSRAALAANQNNMDEKLITWLPTRTIIRNDKPLLVITIDNVQYPLKKLMAKHFIKQFNDKIHYLKHLNGDYQDCRLLNLTLQYRDQTLAKHIAKRNKIPIKIIHRVSRIQRYYDSLSQTAQELSVSVKTLRNYLQRKVYNSVLDEYKFYVKGKMFIPRKKKGVSYTTLISVAEKSQG
jgi:hypothetical protein